MRGDPAVPLGRLRARGMLQEIRAHDLRFTAREARALLLDGFGVALDAPEVQRLVERTEGWPAGLCLAGLSLRDHPDPPAFVRDFAGDHRHVGEYLMEEVLRAEPPEVREFLLRTSLPARLSGALCDAMLERTGSAALLATLERRNQFLIPLDERHEWYRYHHLFGDFLRGELLAQEPELVPVLHRRAAAWLRATADVNLAIHHAAAGGAYEDAAAMIVSNGPLWTRHGRPATVAAWLDLLPDDYAARDPQLAASAAWYARMSGLDQLTFRAYARWAALPDGERPWVGVAGTQATEVALLHIFEAYDDVGATVHAARAAARIVPRDDPSSCIAQTLLGIALLHAGRFAEAIAPLNASLARSTDPGHAIVHDSTLALLASAEAHCGHVERGRDLAERALAFIAQHDLASSPSIGWAYTAAAEALLAGGEVERALPLAARAAELQARPAPDVTYGHALLVLARASATAGDAPGALHTLQRVRAAIAGAGDAAYIASCAAALEMRLGAAVPAAHEPLSARELDVLRLLASDLSQREIGAALFVSINTVKSHVRAILRKLDAGTRAEAVEHARRRGLIEGP
jgi:LuxR family maltose regulon positive regulatory protein